MRLSHVRPAGYLAMFLLGLANSLYGPAIVFISAETGLATGALGILFVLHYAGFLAGTVAANRLAKRLEVRRALAVCTAVVALGALALIALAAPANLAAPLLIGFGAGMTEVLDLRTIEFLAARSPAAELNRVNAMWGLGALVMPLVVGGVTALGLNWRAAGVALVAVALLVSALFLRWREFAVPHAAEVKLRGFNWRSIVLFVLMIVVYVGAETAVGDWATTFFAQSGQGALVGAGATSLFFLTFTAGRLLLASQSERLGYPRAVQLAMLISAATLALALVPPVAVIGFALTGIAYSIVFPTLFAWSARRHPDIRPQMASIVLGSVAAGAMAFPYALGWAVQLLGPPSLPAIVIALSLAVVVLARFEPGPGEVNR